MADKAKKRGALKTKITNFSKFLAELQAKSDNEVTNIDIIQLEERLKRFELVIDEFDQLQTIIETESDSAGAELQERESFENNFYLQVARAKQIIKDNIQSQVNHNISQIQSHHTPQNHCEINNKNTCHVKLPTIQLPKFDGNYACWLEFRDTYESLIHSNESISEIQKFHYLRAALEGSAIQAIRSLEFTVTNYAVAWNALLDRYDNKNLLIHNHVKELFDIEPLPKESPEGLRKIIDTLSKNLRALEQLGQPTHNWDTLIVYMISLKLDAVSIREWERCKAGKDVRTLPDLKTFLKTRAELLETLQVRQHDKKAYTKNTRGFLNTEASQDWMKCRICNKSHYIQNCQEFLKLSIDKRREKLLALKLCLNCLRPGHTDKVCRRTTCKKCQSKHNTLLHNERTTEQCHDKPGKSADSHAMSVYSADAEVLLSTAYIQILDSKNSPHTVRALLDSGSQSSYITKDLCEKLNLTTTKETITVCGLNNTLSNIEAKCDIRIESLHNNFSADISCFVVPQITGNLPSVTLNVFELEIPKSLRLADPSFYEPHNVEVLIGADLFWRLLCVGQIQLGTNKPVLQKTRLGWIVSGLVIGNRTPIASCNFSCNLDLQTQLARFWELEECVLPKTLSKEEEECEAHFVKTTKRESDGTFVVSIPLKDCPEKLGDSYDQAERRFLTLERKLQSKPELKVQYSAFMDEYQELGHMTKIENQNPKISYYMPHHCVIRDSSITTKLRVVFDASAPTTSGLSLNDLQMTGPVIQDDLFSILLRFRQHRYVVAGDIAKMYRQIKILPEERNLQRILWRDNPDKPLDIFQLNTVTYGTTAASFLSVRCLHQLAQDNKIKYPQLAEIIERDFYIDDMLTGANSKEETAQIAKGVSNILKQGCFELRKFYANDPDILKDFVDDASQLKVLKFGQNENAKTLGLVWCPSTDVLKYNISDPPKGTKISKRTILSQIAQVFDPLGLLSPYIINAKILLQQLWLEKVTWDEGLPLHIHSYWTKFRSKLSSLNDLCINRHVCCKDQKYIELHGFSDASEKAYGACIYLRTIDRTGKIFVSLLCSKTKVAPLKKITLPRLELAGALILAVLADKVTKALRLKIESHIFWTDSTIVLGWLKIPPNKLKTFVSNRVAEIQKLTSSGIWRHIYSSDNPADCLSRGVQPDESQVLQLWWNGPSWLGKEKAEWPKQITLSKAELPETKSYTQSFISYPLLTFSFENFSNLQTLKRVLSWILRFKNNCQRKEAGQPMQAGSLTVSEINKAFKVLLKIAQCNSFSAEIQSLKNKKPSNFKSRILNLDPFLDDEGILRVGGRLKNSNFCSDKRHPILLCSKHRLTQLIFKDEHLRLMHAGPQHLLASIRERFWPVRGRNLATKIIKQCVTCFRSNPKPIQPIMGQLPKFRVQPASPFNTTGVDYAGPLLIKDRKGRGGKISKCYIGLFICFATKAVHLELISDLTKDAFVMAFRRFVARRGMPARVLSDNGSNFIGAYSELKHLGEFLKQSKQNIDDHFSQNNIEWQFIPPHSPHFGGLWEAGVKSAKRHIKTVLGNAHLTFEELNTLLVQVEAVLNSRPLFPMSSNPNDLVPLTPAHFLVGRPLVAVPDVDLKEVPTGRLLRFQHIQQCLQHFWKRWQSEYVPELQRLTKWGRNHDKLEKDMLVILKDDNAPPLRWKLGRIVAVHPGKDGINRVVTVKTSAGEVKRSFAKLCPLPLDDDDGVSKAEDV